MAAVPTEPVPPAGTEPHQQLVALRVWCDSGDARRAARALASRYGLPLDGTPELLVDEAASRTAERMLRHGALEAHPDGGDAVAAYARRVMRNTAVDLLRARRPGGMLLDADPARAADGPEPPDPPDPSAGDELSWVEVARTLDDLRRSLHERLRPPARSAATPAPWPAAAALTLLVLGAERGEGVSVRPGTPQPEHASDTAGDRWAGLWYAGRRDCFPEPGGADTGAVRNRRARALSVLDRTLRDAAADAGIGRPTT